MPGIRPSEVKAISTAHGRSVALPYSSWLNQLPQRPTACARAMPGATASAYAGSERRGGGQPIHAPSAPNAIAPQMPSPPSQTLKASTQSRPSLKYS
ncbi:hypothetical protein STENM223S_03385 [Streptomyces tendae]